MAVDSSVAGGATDQGAKGAQQPGADPMATPDEPPAGDQPTGPSQGGGGRTTEEMPLPRTETTWERTLTMVLPVGGRGSRGGSEPRPSSSGTSTGSGGQPYQTWAATREGTHRSASGPVLATLVAAL